MGGGAHSPDATTCSNGGVSHQQRQQRTRGHWLSATRRLSKQELRACGGRAPWAVGLHRAAAWLASCEPAVCGWADAPPGGPLSRAPPRPWNTSPACGSGRHPPGRRDGAVAATAARVEKQHAQHAPNNVSAWLPERVAGHLEYAPDATLGAAYSLDPSRRPSCCAHKKGSVSAARPVIEFRPAHTRLGCARGRVPHGGVRGAEVRQPT